MRLLIFGGSGQTGIELTRLAMARGYSVLAPSHAELDIRNAQRVAQAIADAGADAVINLTAFHVLELCESAPAEAMAVNCTAVGQMAQACELARARFITVSTDYVFDGEAVAPYGEDAVANPLQAYGVSKLAGERAAAVCGALIVRTCGLYGLAGSRERGGNFVEKRLADMRTNSRIEVGSDLVCTPTSALGFAGALCRLAAEPLATAGIYHLSNEGQCSWAEFTQAIAQLAGSTCSVIPVDRAGNYGAIRRPRYSVMANVRASSLGIRLPHWRSALEEYMQKRSTP